MEKSETTSTNILENKLNTFEKLIFLQKLLKKESFQRELCKYNFI